MKNKKLNELAICGMEAVKALEKAHGDIITRFYFNQERASQFGGLCRRLAAAKKPYNCVKDDKELEKLCGSVHHQGVVAMIPQPKIPQLDSSVIDSWIKKKEHIILLDRVGNANNLGAIIKSAVFFGIDNIVIPLDEAQSSVSTSSYRVAQGGMEYVRLYTVESCTKFMQDLKNKMVRIGTEIRAKKTLKDLPLIANNKPVLLVLGNEENGISKDVIENCDELIRIEGKEHLYYGNTIRTAVESLNVAQAATLFFYELNKLNLN